MWALWACLYVNGAVMACEQATRVYDTEEACRRDLIALVQPIKDKEVLDAGQDLDMDCVRQLLIVRLPSDVDRSRG